jgi:hypothetical protein
LIGNFEKVRTALRAIFKELRPRFSLLQPWALLHLIPQYEGGYTTAELRAFKEAAELSGVSFCWLSTFERLYTDAELVETFS